MPSQKYRRSPSFAKRYVDELPSPDRVLRGPVPKELSNLFLDARIAADRYHAALAEADARERGINGRMDARHNSENL